MGSYSQYFALPPAVFENPYFATLLPIAVGTAIGFSTRPKETQRTYLEIKQPPLRPPPWAFGPVWTTLYGLMGYASHRAWVAGHSSINPTTVGLAKHGALVYTAQLVLNFIWMPLFFGNGKVVAATVDILALTGTVGYLAHIWSQIDDVSAYCLVPYLTWLGLATYLTIGVGILNDWSLERKAKKP